MVKSEHQDIARSTSTSSDGAKSTVLLSGKAKIAAVAIIFLVGVVYLAWTAFNEATVEFLSVEDAVKIEPSGDANSVGVLGKLVPGSYIRSPDGVTANFKLKDEHGSVELPVVYSGEVGQVFFNDHSEIILNGTMGSDGTLQAEMLTVRCPSKYLTEQEQMELDGEVDPPPYQPDYFDANPDA